MTILAINKIHQSKVNRAVKTLLKYNALNDLRNIADDNGEEKLYKKLDKNCLNTFDKYLDIVSELPKREKARIEKQLY
jgi:hypothetical protein